jgi:PAS domain S-box-containing protein
MAQKRPRHTGLERERPASDVPSGPGAAVPSGDDPPVGLHEIFAALVESSDDAIVSKDLHGTIMSWNKAAERIFGYTAEEAISRPITMLLPADRFQEEATILATLVRGERIDHFETDASEKTAGGSHLSVSPIKDALDVSSAERRLPESRGEKLDRREQTLARGARAAESANRAKDAFLAIVSHELRSPLSPILAWARMLRMKTLDEKNSTRALEVIERAALAQAQLIDDLLDVSRIASGKLRLEVRPVDLGAVVERDRDRPACGR